MNQGQTKPDSLIETTDCLEAVNVFKLWKTIFASIIIICMVLLQASFWVVDTGFVSAGPEREKKTATAAQEKKPVFITKETKVDANNVAASIKTDIEKAAETVADNAAEPAEKANTPTQSLMVILHEHFTIEQVVWLIRFFNFILIPTAVLYCLTMLFSLKVSMLGRLGGINHIARAFFLSLIMLVLLLPWQVVFDGIVSGWIFTPDNLLNALSKEKTDIISKSLYYLRFTGYWLLVLLFLMFAQIRNARWANATYRRLEVI